MTLERDEAQRALQALQDRLKERGAASQAEVDAAQDRLNKANADISVLQHRTGPQAVQTRDASAKASIENARAAIAAARQLISDSNITAPFDGTIYLLPAKRGNYVNAGDLFSTSPTSPGCRFEPSSTNPRSAILKIGESGHRSSGTRFPDQLARAGAYCSLQVVARGNCNVGELLTTRSPMTIARSSPTPMSALPS